MADTLFTNDGLPGFGLQSKDHEEVLDVIDDLRSQGISQYISLPQLIVCGDQSSGKSSVLNAISGLSFPAKDNVCTRFATELVLRRSDLDEIKVRIQPDAARPDTEQDILRKFRPSSISLEHFDQIVELAGEIMSVGSDGKAFFRDVLRVEVTGPKQPHLTMVDLPGLFHADTTEQTGAEVVDSMVMPYMKNKRSIILAVISAKNELALQKVTKLTRHIDPIGERTLGIITKPDWLRPGSDMESLFVTLANNENIKFRLGWHVLKNRDYEHRNCSGVERDRLEADWLSSGIWASLPRHQVGVKALKDRLGAVLQDLILSELPSLTQEAEKGVKSAEVSLVRLGDSRKDISQQRRYLLHSSERFASLVSHAISGSYDADIFFGDAMTDDGFQKRLRAVFKCALRDFSEKIRINGQAQRIIDDEDFIEEEEGTHISRTKYIEQVRKHMERSQGRELPGTYNPLIIGDLFYAQAKPWKGIVYECADDLLKSARLTLFMVLDEVVDKKTAEGLRKHIINPAMDATEQELRVKVSGLLKPHQEGHPITFNHYFTENVQKARERHWKKALSEKLSSGLSEHDKYGNPKTFTKADVLNAVSRIEDVDMERFACSEAIDCMQAYYNVARRTFVDDFSVLAIETCLLKKLPSILSPRLVDALNNMTVQNIAAETAESQSERARLTEKLENLQVALKTLHRLDRHKPEDRLTLSSRNLEKSTVTPASEEESAVMPELEEESVGPPEPEEEPVGLLEPEEELAVPPPPFEFEAGDEPGLYNALELAIGTKTIKKKKKAQRGGWAD